MRALETKYETVLTQLTRITHEKCQYLHCLPKGDLSNFLIDRGDCDQNVIGVMDLVMSDQRENYRKQSCIQKIFLCVLLILKVSCDWRGRP